VKVTLLPGSVSGRVAAIPSKSHLHRLLICASLVNTGETFVNKPTHLRFQHSQAEDINATVDCLSALGAKIETVEEGFIVTPIDRHHLPDGAVLPCGESGSTLRFMLPMVCALGVSGKFTMSGRLPERPLAPLDTELSRHGVRLWRSNPNTLCCEGKLTARDYILPGNISSQYISGLLLALPLMEGNSSLTVTEPIESADYMAMTIQTVKTFDLNLKITKNRYEIHGSPHFYPAPKFAHLRFEGAEQTPNSSLSVEGDWSNAAFWLCAGAMPRTDSSGGNIEVSGLDRQSVQGDREICAILERIGAHIEWKKNVLCVSEDKRHGVEIDASAIPDLVPVLCAVAAVSTGETIVKNAERLRLKESDRLSTTSQTLNALGAKITEEPSGLRIQGVSRLTGGIVDAWGDHRIAMMAAIASLACEGVVTITGAQAVRNSYPAFWEKFRALGKGVIIEE
jgi:3-phosphoshikimate 1-carboxyvinyltransferase